MNSRRSSVRFRLNVEKFVEWLFVCICMICMWLEEHLYNVPSEVDIADVDVILEMCCLVMV